MLALPRRDARQLRPHLTRRRVALLGLAIVVLLLLAHPVAGAAGPDPLRNLTGDSPLCAKQVGAAARHACSQSGAIEAPYPIDNYRFDWSITTGVTRIEGNFMSVIQWLGSILWVIVLYALKGVLLAMQWAFSLDLLDDSMTAIRRSLLRLHESVLGRSWFLAGISVLGLWGVMRGFVQQRTIQTLAGLAQSIALMGIALAIIHSPQQTIGPVSKTVNQASLAFLSGVADGTIRKPERALAQANEAIFNTAVLRPWCALEFADVDWCLKRAPGDNLTHAERWLRYGPGSDGRKLEYAYVHKAPDKPLNDLTNWISKDSQIKRFGHSYDNYEVTKAERPKVHIQGQPRTVMRMGILLLIVFGLSGCILLHGLITVKLLFQAMLALVLLMFAPVALIAACFGERGRAFFRAWGLRLFAAIASKAIYALTLAIVMSVSILISELDSVPFLVGWALQGIFWWGLLLKHKELFGWLSGLAPHGGDGGGGGYLAQRAATRAALRSHATSGPATAALAGTIAGAWLGGRHATGAIASRRASHGDAIRAVAGRELEQRAQQRLSHRYDQARAQLTGHDKARETLDALAPGLARYDAQQARLNAPGLHGDEKRAQQAEQQRVAAAQAKTQRDGGAPQDPAQLAHPTLPTAAEAKLLKQRTAAESAVLDPGREAELRAFTATADQRSGRGEPRFSDQQIQSEVAHLHREAQRSADDEVHAWRAGIPESQLRKLPPAERAQLTERIGDDLERDRKLLAVARPRADKPRASDRRAAHQVLDKREVREHRRQELAQRKARSNDRPQPDASRPPKMPRQRRRR